MLSQTMLLLRRPQETIERRLHLRLPPDLPDSWERELPRILGPIGRIPGFRTAASRFAINKFANAAPPRPHPYSMAADYTTWQSLTDRTYSGRHLPPGTTPPEDLPSEQDVTALFRRPRNEEVKSTDTSVTFVFFAQWFTDSFLRTDRKNPAKNTSPHEIDLCQIYGLSAEKTDKLRSKTGGHLKSQRIRGEEYPPYLFEPRDPKGPLIVKEEFKGLHDEDVLFKEILARVPDDRMDFVFAVGLEHGNSTIGHTMLDTIFLREHNRIADVLNAAHPEWEGNDERLFQTTRNIMIVLLLKLVVEEYIMHIGPFDFPVEMVKFMADGERWNRANRGAIEFNLLYRWHPLAPDWIGEGANRLEAKDFLSNNPLVLSRGIESLIAQCSHERSGKIGLFNTPHYLSERMDPNVASVEERTVALMRHARLRTFNEYREYFGLNPIHSFEELTDDEAVQDRLREMYGHIDNLEWYVGIFAEDYPDYMMMGWTMTTMVAHDAFTQALTNPLLAKEVFNVNTFTQTGMDIIEGTRSLEHIIKRNATDPDAVDASFKC
ncbi:peroxidase family protein [Gordonia sp. NPDC003585]|uniref:peroxidase family protein n=1 Tax=Gordonia sp. NPDC003585 TaxID=3154275 RepID=UPI0033B2089B